MHREMASGLAQEEAPGFGGGLAQRHGADLMLALAMVGPWSGVRRVSPRIISTCSNATSNSSATICASAVRMPVPRST